MATPIDPIANLEAQRRCVHDITHSENEEWEPEDEADVWRNRATELAELVQAMDEWRKNGGFDPYTKNEGGCPDEGQCHGCLKWCDECGNVKDVCHNRSVCRTHNKCPECHEFLEFDCMCELKLPPWPNSHG